MATPSENVTPLLLASQEASAPVINWWLNHWAGPASPFTRMQIAWMETLYEAMQMEAELLTACATSQQQVINCMSEKQSLNDPEVMGSCYRDVMQGFINAHLHRIDKVNELAQDFRQRMWEEI